ncbi:MAG: TIR domain-containing protein [Rhodocyclaceae bacterium]|nr:TIR domain-containing protein [Rhodocyclaceae bacterium]
MSALFISHSSADNAVAREVAARLADMGHGSVFLDFDPALGIPAGRNWEQELYARLRACQAVVVLCSRASAASAWCFAEITHARALGKAIFPLRTDEAEISPLLRDLQVIDLLGDPDQAWQRLRAGLIGAGLDPARLFQWDAARPPYPGLLALQKDDAAVYFGRESAVLATLEALNRLQRLAGARMLLLLGASGSGKSSLLRAGVVPRLERDSARWMVLPPFRPLGRPFERLAQRLAALAGNGDAEPWRALLQRSDSAAAWDELVDRLQVASGRQEASLLVAIDQFEELLVPADDAQSLGFLRMLEAIAARPDAPLVIVATLRSDFLGALQTHPALQHLSYEALPLSQIAATDLVQVIEGPARVAGIELESGLAAAMVADTASEDALPLLAFALREMWDRCGASGRFTLSDYRDRLGGLQGALARAAEALCDERALPAPQLADLRAALIRLVRIDGDARFVRQTQPWDAFPASVQPLLERFVQARLLVARDEAGERVLEVAHEALFRAWDRLVVWLNADREFLLWRERLRNAQAEWLRNGADASLLLRGPLLREAQKWDKERGGELDPPLRQFIVTSAAARAERDAEQRRQRRRVAWMVAAAALLLVAVGVVAVWQWQQRDAQQRLALAREKSAEAAQADDMLARTGLVLQSLAQAWTPDAQAMLLADLARLARPLPAPWKPHPGPVHAMALSPDGRWLATADEGHLQVQSQGAEPRLLGRGSFHNRVQALAFSPDGRWLAAACAAQQVCIYDVADWQLVKQWQHDGFVSALAFSPDGKWFATVSHEESKPVHLHALPSWEEQAKIQPGVGLIFHLAFRADSTTLDVMGDGFESWRIEPGAANKLAEEKTPYGLQPDPELASPSPFPAGPGCLAVSRDDGRFALCGRSEKGIQVWALDPPRHWISLAAQPARSVAFGAGHEFLAGGDDGRILAWNPDAVAQRVLVHAAEVRAIALSPDSRWLASASGTGTLRLFDTRDGSERPALQLQAEIEGLAFSPDGRRVAAYGGPTLWIISVDDWREPAPIVHDAPVLRVEFDPAGGRLATITQWDKHTIWIERANGARQLRVYDIASRAEQASALVVAGRGNRSLTAPTSLDAEVAADARAIMRGDAALTERALGWFSTADTHTPTAVWLNANTSKGERLDQVASEAARAAMNSNRQQSIITFGADGGLMASAEGGKVWLWPLRSEQLVAEACARLLRGAGCPP